MFYAGIDWADQKHDALVLDEAGHQVGSIRVPHPVDGVGKLNAWLQFAWQSTQQEAWAKAYYERKRAEGKSHSVAVRALSNSWARILFAMLRSHEHFGAATFEVARHLLHAPTAA